MKRFFLLAAMLLAPALAWGQQTTIAATVTDPSGRPYTFLTGNASIQCPGNQQPTFNGSPLTRTISITGGDGNGHFTQVLWDVNSIVPTGCSWRWEITWSDGVTNFITGNIGGVTGAGPVDLSAAISAFSVPLPASAGAVGSVSGVTPIVATPNPIISIGTISCPTCFSTASHIPIGNVGSVGLSGTSPISIASTGVISCATCATSASALTLNQLVIGAGGQGTSTLGTLGTTTTLLHGNAAGAPTFSAVNLAADVTGQLPIGSVGSAGLSGVTPISIAATGAISCSTCQALGTAVIKKGTNAGDYSSSSASFVNVDGTNLSYTVTIPVGVNLVIQVSFVIDAPAIATSVTTSVAIADGGTAITGPQLSFQDSNGDPSQTPGNLLWLIAGDGMAHTISLQYKKGGGSASNAILFNSNGVIPVMIFSLQ